MTTDPPSDAEPTPGNYFVGVGRSDVTGPIAQVNMVSIDYLGFHVLLLLYASFLLIVLTIVCKYCYFLNFSKWFDFS